MSIRLVDGRANIVMLLLLWERGVRLRMRGASFLLFLWDGGAEAPKEGRQPGLVDALGCSGLPGSMQMSRLCVYRLRRARVGVV